MILLDKEGRGGVEEFGSADASLLSGFAAQAAMAIENARLYETALEQERTRRELSLAANIQQNLLPHSMPELHGYELAAHTVACRTVGGDFYDFIPLPEGRYLIVVADVAGKGIPAALLVFTMSATLHALVSELAAGMPLPEFVAKVNESVHRSSTTSRFITAFFGILDPSRGILVSVNAGHNAPLLISEKRDGPVELSEGGLCLGMFDGMSYTQEVTELLPGDLLAMYSDGVTEAQDCEQEEFGVDNLLTALRKDGGASGSAGAAIESVVHAVDAFVKDAGQFDDLTMVVLRRYA